MLHTGKWILFRSAGSQSKRYNFAELPEPAVFPTVDAGSTTRSASLFDLLTDVSRANQSLSPTLMAVAPLFDNILPFGHATPNRRGGNWRWRNSRMHWP